MILWHSVVGSHMWGRNHEGSDIDIIEIYRAHHHDILVGKTFKGKFTKQSTLEELGVDLPVEGTHVEVTRIEIGHLISLLKKGNINALWMVLSPITTGGGFLEALKKVVLDNLSTRTWFSVRGMIKNTIRLKKGKQADEKIHRYQMITRTLDQFEYMLDTGEIKWDFPVVKSIDGLDERIDSINERIESGNYSILQYPDESQFDRYIIATRMSGIREEINKMETIGSRG